MTSTTTQAAGSARCSHAPDPRRYGTGHVDRCQLEAGHTGCHVSHASDHCLTGFVYSIQVDENGCRTTCAARRNPNAECVCAELENLNVPQATPLERKLARLAVDLAPEDETFEQAVYTSRLRQDPAYPIRWARFHQGIESIRRPSFDTIAWAIGQLDPMVCPVRVYDNIQRAKFASDVARIILDAEVQGWLK
jgi:hypothetical protein